MNKVKVVDAPCGSGKTTWSIHEINSHPDDAYIFCTPLLSEIDRIRRDPDDPEAPGCGKRMREPHNFNSSKLDDFEKLLGDNECIAVTHSTFLNATNQTMDLIAEGNYTLILDETVEAITEFNKLAWVKDKPEQRVSSKDFDVMLDDGQVEVGADCKIKWTGSARTEGTKHSEFAKLCKLGRLYLARGELIICMFPHKIFEKFKEVVVLTYLFEGTALRCYFDLFGIPYELVSIGGTKECPELVEHNDEADKRFREFCKKNIKICDDLRLNASYLNSSFSKNWYDGHVRRTKSKLKHTKVKQSKGVRDPWGIDWDEEFDRRHEDPNERIPKDLRCFFEKHTGAKASKDEVMWTCPKDFRKVLTGKGYTQVRRMTAKEKELPSEERKELERKLTCFVPLNCRGTNDYKHRWALAYLFNMFANTMIAGFFKDTANIDVNNDLFAIGCLIQWVSRSRIRDDEAEDRSIVLYLPNPRMYRLLMQWMEGEL